MTEYTPAFAGLLEVYLRPESRSLAWQASLAALSADRFERLRSLDQQSEKEFLLGLRRLALSQAGSMIDSNPQPPAPSLPQHPAVERLLERLASLPLIHQQVVLLKFGGYDESVIERVLRITPAVAQQSLERLGEARIPPAEWLAVLDYAWSAGTENCPSARRLIRIQEGQVSWYDRDPVEQHLAACLHCLELWTALGEVRYWRRESQPLASAKAEELLAALPIQTTSAPRPSLLGRILRSNRMQDNASLE